MLKQPLNTVHMSFGDASISEFVHHLTGFIPAKFGAFFTKCTISHISARLATESKACDLAKFLDPEKETLFCSTLL